MSNYSVCKIVFEESLRKKSTIKFPCSFQYPVMIDDFSGDIAWTAEIVLYDYFDMTSNALIKLLVDDAPHHLMVSGTEFWLSPGFRSTDNGRKLVVLAKGKII